jgi:hypothetical protein
VSAWHATFALLVHVLNGQLQHQQPFLHNVIIDAWCTLIATVAKFNMLRNDTFCHGGVWRHAAPGWCALHQQHRGCSVATVTCSQLALWCREIARQAEASTWMLTIPALWPPYDYCNCIHKFEGRSFSTLKQTPQDAHLLLLV